MRYVPHGTYTRKIDYNPRGTATLRGAFTILQERSKYCCSNRDYPAFVFWGIAYEGIE